MLRIFKYLFLLMPAFGFGQQYTLNGSIFNEAGETLPYATAVFLDPSDSTFLYFGISNLEGSFEIKNVKQGHYLLQVAFLGYETYYKSVEVPLQNGSKLGTIVLKERNLDLAGVNIVGERVPMRIKKDTLEFDAGAFKTRPGDVAEDLLKKLPGVEVDRAGNIKALGENVNQVMVDGKEFFGNDPKVATKNLPADALDKVQVIDKKSEESEFTGIDDGQRNKAVNLVLKEDKKDGIFGDIEAGLGTDDHYKGAAKVYRFSDKTQFAALGMLNNINQYGFSFNDYLNFSGGLSSMVGGGGGQITIGGDGSLPINFGQPVTGLTTSGAGGLNFSVSKTKLNRVFLSYMINGNEKKLEELTNTQNFTEQGIYRQTQESFSKENKYAHNVNFGLRRRIDSTQNLILNAKLSFNNGKSPGNSSSMSYYNDTLVNSLLQNTSYFSDRITSNAGASYQKKFNANRSVFKLRANLELSKTSTDDLFDNQTRYYNPPSNLAYQQYQNDVSSKLNYSATASFIQNVRYFTVEPNFQYGQSFESISREQGIPVIPEVIIDSLSPDFTKNHNWIKPAISIRRDTEKTNLMLGLALQNGSIKNSLWDDEPVVEKYLALLPSMNWELEYRTGKRISVYYDTRINTPAIQLMQPVSDYRNPLFINYGNRDLESEYIHNLSANWLIFDQFSSTSVFSNVNASYTKNKINWERNIDQQLVQTMKPVNVSDDYVIEGGLDFSTPIRKLGIKTNVRINEKYNRGINIINGVSNINKNLTHRFSLRFDNRKKDKWDVATGAAVEIANSWYSVQESLDNKYFNFSWFSEIAFSPNDSWSYSAVADITNYSAESFDSPISVPLISAEVSYNFLKNKRGELSLNLFDLLDKNTNILRVGEMNYLMEKQSNSIGRYVMLSFKYRLNKFGGKGGGIEIEFDN